MTCFLYSVAVRWGKREEDRASDCPRGKAWLQFPHFGSHPAIQGSTGFPQPFSLCFLHLHWVVPRECGPEACRTRGLRLERTAAYRTASESLANSASLSSEKTNKASMSPLLGAPPELPLRTLVFTFLGSYSWCLEAITQWLLP